MCWERRSRNQGLGRHFQEAECLLSVFIAVRVSVIFMSGVWGMRARSFWREPLCVFRTSIVWGQGFVQRGTRGWSKICGSYHLWGIVLWMCLPESCFQIEQVGVDF